MFMKFDGGNRSSYILKCRYQKWSHINIYNYELNIMAKRVARSQISGLLPNH